MSPLRRMGRTLLLFAAVWLAVKLVFSLVRDEPFRLIGGDGTFELIILAALIFGAGVRFVVDSRSRGKRHG